MLKTKIRKVRFIKNDSKGNTINLHVIETSNGKPAIIRRPKEFLQDLKNSELIDDNVASILHPQVRQARKSLKNGVLEGEIQYVSKGDKWTVTENSLCITDPTHPDYGNASIGDVRTIESDQARVVDGFLELEENLIHQEMRFNAQAMAQMKADLLGAFDDNSTSTTSSTEDAGETTDFDAIPTDILATATAGEASDEEDTE